MSNELTYFPRAHFVKGGTNVDAGGSGSRTADVTGSNVSAGTLDLTVSFEAVPLGDVATPGFYSFENLGSQAVEICDDPTSQPRIKVPIGQVSNGWLGSGMLHPCARAATGTTRLKFLIVEV